MRHYSPLIKRRLSMESIDFQTDKVFPKELDKLTQEIIDITKDTKPLNQRNLELALKDTNRKIDTLFKERFGITTTLQVNLNTLAHTIPFIINKNHVLLKNGYRGLIKDEEQDTLLKNYHNKKGTIYPPGERYVLPRKPFATIWKSRYCNPQFDLQFDCLPLRLPFDDASIVTGKQIGRAHV